MAKFDTSQFANFWGEGGKTLSTQILQNPNLIHSNHTFWQQNFSVNTAGAITQPDGSATFRSECRRIESGVLMDLRAPLGDSTPIEQGNLAFYTGVIPDLISKGYVETAMERMYKEKLFSQIGDAQLIDSYIIPYYQFALDSANMTLSNMAAQILSTGKIIYKYGEGAGVNILKADIPAENFLTAGKVVWSDTTNCMLLDQWQELMKNANDKFGVNWVWQLQITRDQFNNYVMKNKQVLDHVRWINNINGILPPTEERVTEEMVTKAISAYPKIPQIVIVDETQNDISLGTVHGWADNNAVLRPLGKAGKVHYTSILDEEVYQKYGVNSIQRSFSSSMFGMGRFMHSVIPNGNLKEWHIDHFISAVPALDEFTYHFIINTAQADA